MVPSSITTALPALVCLAALIPANASAYEWKRSELSGEPLRWFRPELTVRISTVEPEEVPWETMRDIVEASFGAWLEVPDCRIPRVELAGTTDDRSTTIPESIYEEPDNVVVFVRDPVKWRALGGSSTQIALTFITSRPSTGEIVDADIAINDAEYRFTTSDSADKGVDLQAMITHEVGHFFGLAHSLEGAATMHANYAPLGEDQSLRFAARTLDEDDVEGVCSLYEDVPEWDDGADEPAGCSGARAPTAALLGLLLLAAIALRSPRRRRKLAPARRRPPRERYFRRP